jgi:hypothetical protein
MKAFEKHQFDTLASRRELDEFGELLASSEILSENTHVLPFFRERKHLSALLGDYSSQIVEPDLLAFEYDLFGDFTCDLVVGDSRKRAFLLTEFEEAGPESIFVGRKRVALYWSSCFDQGYSQIIDWLFKLSDMRSSLEFENRFGNRHADFSMLLVVGRSSPLSPREHGRLNWRKQKVVVDSVHINCLTFDELYDDLRFRLEKLAKRSLTATGPSVDSAVSKPKPRTRKRNDSP